MPMATAGHRSRPVNGSVAEELWLVPGSAVDEGVVVVVAAVAVAVVVVAVVAGAPLEEDGELWVGGGLDAGVVCCEGAVVLPSGSVYWLSPAESASAAGASTRNSAPSARRLSA